jgi:hypothetical protein
MYSNPRCKIVINGYFSESFKLSRGVKQGCPLSAYLFIMAIEMLAIKIRSSINIKGLEVQGVKTKLSLYTDDSCFLLNPQLESLHSQIIFLTSLDYNQIMCTILRIGSQKTFTLPCSLPIKWPDGDVNILGVHILKERNDLTPIHFNRKLAKIDLATMER